MEEKSPSTFAKGESTGANQKLTPAPALADREEGWHPALWGLIGGVGVAVAAIIIAFVIPRGGKLHEVDAGELDKPARQSLAQADLKQASEDAPKPAKGAAEKTQPAEALFMKASPAVVTITCKNSKGEITSRGSGFFLKDQFVNNPDDQNIRDDLKARSKEKGRSVQFAYLLTNRHVIRTAARADFRLSDGTSGNIFWVVSDDERADLALLCAMVFSSDSVTSLPWLM